ncbi:ABC transporter ATP-binding protein [Alkalicoccus urumqiensis]|uniref:ABC transporter ATP-binding protein n=1 Tax=Alkalicoccus urumqiensis TaxID=1548213 RepID=A0A2P6MDE2_ALKUR|nr:ABC transporter ATP-binding protein [Alkalicoccus urumqiensis]PRO64292.1 ABC transporter ATP-binding protein [Alkalicoccus urumqiensis]
MMHIRNVSKSFGRVHAVNDVTFSIAKGSCTTLLGPNGAGKTTLLSIAAKLLSADSGTVEIDGAAGDLRRHIGFLPQFPQFYSWMTGSEYMIYAGRLHGLTKKEAALRSRELMEQAGLTEAEERKIAGWSGGMKQRLGMAQALISRPSFLILDEPVSALDPKGRKEVLTLMEEWKAFTGILYSTHVLSDAAVVSDDVVFMQDGKIVLYDTMEGVQSRAGSSSIRIAVTPLTDHWCRDLERAPWVRELRQENDAVIVQLESGEGADRKLLHYVTETGVTLTHWETYRPALEDIFLEVMQS